MHYAAIAGANTRYILRRTFHVRVTLNFPLCQNGNKDGLCEPSCVDVAQLPLYTSAPPIPLPPAMILPPESLSRITDSVVNAVLTADLSFIYSLLFSPQSFEPSPLENGPALINVPDAEGWSAIHYCASVPNPPTEILDAFYCAGADISLFTTWEHYTPLRLHCLARPGCHQCAKPGAPSISIFCTSHSRSPCTFVCPRQE